MTDWSRIERVMDDRSVKHACAFCGDVIPVGDEGRWSLAVREADGRVSTLWVHPGCFLDRVQPSTRLGLARSPRRPPAL